MGPYASLDEDRSTSTKEFLLSSSSSNSDAQESQTLQQFTKTRRKATHLAVVIVAIICQSSILILCIFGGYLAGQNSSFATKEAGCVDTSWDELRNNALEFRWNVFDGHFEDNSEYQGPPDENITARWTSISRLYNLAADYKTLRQANKTKGLVNWPGTDTYMVGLEAFHHLHCLNYIRKYTYMDYYEDNEPDMISETMEERRNHKDHCIEMLRQKLMCTPDLNIYSYHWLDALEHPYTGFHTRHRCVDWDKLFEWLMGKVVRHGILNKPEDAETLF